MWNRTEAKKLRWITGCQGSMCAASTEVITGTRRNEGSEVICPETSMGGTDQGATRDGDELIAVDAGLDPSVFDHSDSAPTNAWGVNSLPRLTSPELPFVRHTMLLLTGCVLHCSPFVRARYSFGCGTVYPPVGNRFIVSHNSQTQKITVPLDN